MKKLDKNLGRCPFSGEGAERLTEKEQYATQLIGLYVLINGMARGGIKRAAKIWRVLDNENNHSFLSDLNGYVVFLKNKLNYSRLEIFLLSGVKKQMMKVGEEIIKNAEEINGGEYEQTFHPYLYENGQDDNPVHYLSGRSREKNNGNEFEVEYRIPDISHDIGKINRVYSKNNYQVSLQDFIEARPRWAKGLMKANEMMRACKPVDLT